MRFADAIWLWGIGFSLVIGTILAWRGFSLSRSLTRFAATTQLKLLLTSRPTVRRTLAGLLLVFAVALAFVALARPQYGKGTRVLPRTNLDVVLVLDYSKSMYARDVSPSRIERSKIEVRRLIQKLAGARFGAVAFAGEPIAFPLTSDGAAIGQFFAGLTPNDMPVGGTATARALEAARQLFARDPLSERHERVVVLITDGEDLEGDPVATARTMRSEGMRTSVVQIGGKSPELIPLVDEQGRVQGHRTDAEGRPLTTHLTEAGEAQLRAIAEAGEGRVVTAGKGETGIDEMAESLRKLMSEELAERVETIFADVYYYPLSLAVLLLLAEVGVGIARSPKLAPEKPRSERRRRIPRRLRDTGIVLLALQLLGCSEFDQLFERKSPVVEEALQKLEAGAADQAVELLTSYLETGPCQEGVIGAGERARSQGDASFDLGLAFLDRPTTTSNDDAGAHLTTPSPLSGVLPPSASGAPTPSAPDPRLECALRVLAPVAEADFHPPGLRARAYYLMGNIAFRREDFDSAVDSYGRGLLLSPGAEDSAVDRIGRDLAFNRAIALLRAKEKREQQEKERQNQEENDKDDQSEEEDRKEPDEKDQDPKDQPPPDEPDDKPQDQAEPQQGEQGNEDKPDPQGEDQPDSKSEESSVPDEAPAPPASVSQDERILDQLEQAPTLQKHDAARRAGQGRRSAMEDK